MIRFLATKLPKELRTKDLTRAAEQLSRVLKIKFEREICLSFVTQPAMQALNKQYRKKDRPTDVLSFSVEEAGLPKALQKTSSIWGDVIICPTYAKVEAKRRGLSLREELTRLLVHGTLHLAGFDHATELDEMRMFKLQERVIEEVLYPTTK